MIQFLTAPMAFLAVASLFSIADAGGLGLIGATVAFGILLLVMVLVFRLRSVSGQLHDLQEWAMRNELGREIREFKAARARTSTEEGA